MFYKKLSYLLADDFEFAVIADIDEKLTSNTVYMGGDNTKFYMKVSQHKDDYLEIFKQVKSNHQNTITLLSNAFVENNIFDFATLP